MESMATVKAFRLDGKATGYYKVKKDYGEGENQESVIGHRIIKKKQCKVTQALSDWKK